MKTVELAEYELEALVKWHIDRKYEAANKELYEDAEDHRKRALELELIRTS